MKKKSLIVEFSARGRNITAIGYFPVVRKFTVKKGGTIAPPKDSLLKNSRLRNLREKLVSDGVIKDNRLALDYEFASPSDAIAIIRGTAASNLRQWVSVADHVPMDLFDRTVLKVL